MAHRIERRSRPRTSGNGGLLTSIRRKLPLYAVDVAVLSGAFLIAYCLRFEFALTPDVRSDIRVQLPLVVAVQLAAFFACGIHRFVWRYVGMAEVEAFVRAATWSAVPILCLRFGAGDDLAVLRVPISVTLMDAILGFGGLLAARVLRRLLYERGERRRRHAEHAPATRRRVMLVGADEAGVKAARELVEHGADEFELLGFVDGDPAKHGMSVSGIRVLGGWDDLPHLSETLDLDHVIVALGGLSRSSLRHVVRVCEAISLDVRILPELHEIIEGKIAVDGVRGVELEDLLGREPVMLDHGPTATFLAGKSVMLTGAGGSIGSELARQVAQYGPSALLLVERAEGALFQIGQELEHRYPDLPIRSIVADVGDEPRMRHVFAEHCPEVVLHAAAHKHVPLMETCPCEAVRNNALATHTLGALAGELGADTFVLISTDKAVRPSSVMGATKRLAELVVQYLHGRYATRYVAVRFGNVIGSAGSVISIFREQIRAGGPVTVTHPDMVRYFMTIPEAASLVLRAAAMGGRGELYVLDMGEPVRILDLAEDTIRLSGLRPFDDVEIVFTGVRPGEKLSEQLETSTEALARTDHPKIFAGEISAYPPRFVELALGTLRRLAERGDDRAMRRMLGELVPEATLAEENPTPSVRIDAEPETTGATPLRMAVAE